MNREYLDFIDDILDGMNKAEILLEGVSYSIRNGFSDQFCGCKSLGNYR
jgi:hypothetical protein